MIRGPASLLPVPYYHVVFTLPAAIADIAYQNKAVIYDLLFKASAETLIIIAPTPSTSAPASASPRFSYLGLGAHHSSHVHMIVPAAASRSTASVGWRAARLLPAGACALAPVRRLFLES